MAAEADAVARAVDDAVRTLHALAAPAPALLAASAVGEVDAVRTREAWQGWHVIASGVTADSVAAVDGDAVLGSYDEASRALADLQAKATVELRRRVEAWQPVAAELAGWLASARGAQNDLAILHQVRSALNWLRPVGQDVRDRRMAPFSKLSAAVWEALRQGSNVDLGEVRLEGSPRGGS